MRHYIIHFCIATLATLVLFISLNWLVDPAHLFSQGKYEIGVAQQLNKGKFIAGVLNYDERLLQLYRIQDLQNAKQGAWSVPDTIVIGSSRSMLLNNLAGINALNLSVSGASLEDYIALLHLAKSLPSTKIVIGVDPWVFNINNNQSRWGSICLYWRSGMQELLEQTASERECPENKWKQLINFSYTMASAKLLLSRKLEPAIPAGEWYEKVDDTPEQESDLIRPDGSRVYNRIYAEMPSAKVAAAAKRFGKPPVYSLEGFSRLDDMNKSLFEKLLQQLRREKEVVIFLPPYHPNAYPSVIANAPLVKDAETYLHNLSQKENIELVGSYDPTKVGCTQEEFFDGMHAKISCLKKIFAPYIQLRPGKSKAQ